MYHSENMHVRPFWDFENFVGFFAFPGIFRDFFKNFFEYLQIFRDFKGISVLGIFFVIFRVRDFVLSCHTPEQ